MSSTAPPRAAYLLTGASFLISFLYAIYLGAFGTLLPRVGADFGLGADVQGRIFPATFSGVLVGVSAIGALSDAWGRKPLLLTALTLATLGTGLFAFAPGFEGILLGATLIGAGGGAGYTVSSALVGDLFSARRAVLLNAVQVAFGVGAALASPLVGWLAPQDGAGGQTWRQLFLLLTIGFGAVAALIAVLPAPRTSEAASGLNLSALKTVLRHAYVPSLAVSAALYAGIEVGFCAWQPSYFAQGVRGGAEWAGRVVSVFWIAMTVGRLATGFFIERFDPRLLRRGFSLGVAAGALLTLGFPGSASLTLGFVALTALCAAGLFSLHVAEATQAYPHISGTVIALVVAVAGIGAALLPWLIGTIAGANGGGAGFRAALLLIPVAALGMTGLTLIRPPKGSRVMPVTHDEKSSFSWGTTGGDTGL